MIIMPNIEKNFADGTFAAFAAFTAGRDDIERYLRRQNNPQFFTKSEIGLYGFQCRSTVRPRAEVHIYECEDPGIFGISVHAPSMRYADTMLHDILWYPGISGFRKLEGIKGWEIARKYAGIEERNFDTSSETGMVA